MISAIVPKGDKFHYCNYCKSSEKSVPRESQELFSESQNETKKLRLFAPGGSVTQMFEALAAKIKPQNASRSWMILV